MLRRESTFVVGDDMGVVGDDSVPVSKDYVTPHAHDDPAPAPAPAPITSGDTVHFQDATRQHRRELLQDNTKTAASTAKRKVPISAKRRRPAKQASEVLSVTLEIFDSWSQWSDGIIEVSRASKQRSSALCYLQPVCFFKFYVRLRVLF